MSRRKQQHSRLYRILVVLFFRRRYTLAISLLVFAAMVWGVIYYEWDVEPVPVPQPRTWSQIVASDTLRVVTIESSHTAFRYKGEWYGHEYSNAKAVAEALGLHLQVIVAQNEQEMVDSLFSGGADVAISPVSFQLVKAHWFLRATGVRWSDSQCLVSSRRLKTEAYQDSLLTDSALAMLPHYKLTVIRESRQWMVYGDDSVRAHFDFRPYVIDSIPADSLTSEQLTDSMMAGRTDAVMLRCSVARLMHDYYPSLFVTDTIPFSADSLAWMVTAGADTLRHHIDSVSAAILEQGAPHYSVRLKRYGDQKRANVRRAARFVMREGAISPYDDLFRSKGLEYGIDWRLLAAVAYIESNFNHAIVSGRGPVGLMQLMPQTISKYGYTREEALDPEINVTMGATMLSDIRDRVRNRLPGITDNDAICFALTGYNAGIGHLYDAIRLAETLGYKANVWSNNVEHCLRLKSDPQYYRMSVVKSGRFNGDFTINYVNEVMAAYHAFCTQKPTESKTVNEKNTTAD